MTTNYKQQYQAVAAQYDRVWATEQGQTIGESLEKWPFFQRQPSAHVYAIDKLGRLTGKEVLELGCGAGYTTLELASQAARVTAVDLSTQALTATRRLAQENGLAQRVRTLQASAEALPVEDGSYDAIFAQNFLMHVTPEQVGRECWRVLRPGGRAVFVEPLDHHPLIKLYHRLLSPYKASPTGTPATNWSSWPNLSGELASKKAFTCFQPSPACGPSRTGPGNSNRPGLSSTGPTSGCAADYRLLINIAG